MPDLVMAVLQATDIGGMSATCCTGLRCVCAMVFVCGGRMEGPEHVDSGHLTWGR